MPSNYSRLLLHILWGKFNIFFCTSTGWNKCNNDWFLTLIVEDNGSWYVGIVNLFFQKKTLNFLDFATKRKPFSSENPDELYAWNVFQLQVCETYRERRGNHNNHFIHNNNNNNNNNNPFLYSALSLQQFPCTSAIIIAVIRKSSELLRFI